MTNVTSLVEGQAPEEAEIVVICRIAVVIFLQPDDGIVVLHIIGKVDADTAYWVILDLVHEERGISDVLANPVGIWTLGNSPLQNVWLVDSFEELVEVAPVRYQRRLF